jgi:hypothetical protein
MKKVVIAALAFFGTYSAQASDCSPQNSYDIAAQAAMEQVSSLTNSDGTKIDKVVIKRIHNTPVNERSYTRIVDVTASVDGKLTDFQVGLAIDIVDCKVSAIGVSLGKNNYILPD